MSGRRNRRTWQESRLQEAWSSILFLVRLQRYHVRRSLTPWPTEIREHSCRSGNCTRQTAVEFLGARLRTVETSLLLPWIQGRHAGLPSFRSMLWARAVDEEPNRFYRSGSPELLTCRFH